MNRFQLSVATIITTLFLCTFSNAKNSLAIGDLVLRSGPNMDSVAIQKLGNVQYSHIGIITQIEPEIIVVHSTTDDDPNSPNQVIATSFDIFTSPKFSRNILIIRPNFLTLDEKLNLANNVYSKLGAPYILKSREEKNLYCTTLIEQPLLQLRPNIQLEWHTIDFGPFKGSYLFPDTFMNIEGMEILNF
ncbi:YiiX/YebB-like N1pC/P60 family cysteine hydrolase [Wohlfahrtiimonas larvae]|uniref:Permuted papain-like amidase YaeF/Yiix C92 family enzyme n=1 Tax=Wohlfahrtiimonas larvae TaxID=1157986 RepID=A0ABP9MCE6_9GAMM|nr:YiiX/YebB-like N1pC/P60 family cysteine hydrolase [Wohlfahrtiimonas larvae]